MQWLNVPNELPIEVGKASSVYLNAGRRVETKHQIRCFSGILNDRKSTFSNKSNKNSNIYLAFILKNSSHI